MLDGEFPIFPLIHPFFPNIDELWIYRLKLYDNFCIQIFIPLLIQQTLTENQLCPTHWKCWMIKG